MRVTRDVDEQVAEQSIHHGRRAVVRGQITKSDLQLVQGVHARLVDAWRLAGRADVHAGKQIRERWMVLPECQHAAQQIRAAQERTVQCGRSANHDMAAAAGSQMAAVIAEFFGRQPITARFREQHCVHLFEFVPIAGGRQVYFQNSGIGSEAERSQPRIRRWSIALQPNWLLQIRARVLDRSHQVQVIREV